MRQVSLDEHLGGSLGLQRVLCGCSGAAVEPPLCHAAPSHPAVPGLPLSAAAPMILCEPAPVEKPFLGRELLARLECTGQSVKHIDITADIQRRAPEGMLLF